MKINDELEMIAFGKKLAINLKSGSVVVLCGDLGVGKTTLTKGIASFFEINNITSPTYNIINEYQTNISDLKFYHIDA